MKCDKIPEKGSWLQDELSDSEKSGIAGQVIDFIERHYSEEITLLDISRHLFLSRKYVSSRFKQETGLTLKRYLALRRVNAACAALQTGTGNFREVFLASGFRDYAAYLRYFKLITGLTPSEYQRQHSGIRSESS